MKLQKRSIRDRASQDRIKETIQRSAHLTSPLGVAADIIALGQFIWPLVVGFIGMRKAQEAAANTLTLTLPLRLLVLIVAMTLLGVAFGFGLKWLTKRNSTPVVFAGHVTALAWAVLVVTVIDAMVPASGPGVSLQFTLFLLIGLGIMMMMLTFILGARTGGTDTQTVRDRASIVLAFSAATVVTAVVVQLGAMA